jgi:HEXXH motif-containing protein
MTRASSLFLPDADNARAIDANVRSRLCGSFSWLSESFDDLDFRAGETEDWLARPVDFGFYYDLASAKYHDAAATDTETARDTVARLIRSVRSNRSAERTVAIRNLSPSEYDEREIDCLVRWFDIEPENRMALLPLSEEELRDATQGLKKALSFIEKNAPDFWGELEAVTTEFIFAKPGPGARFKFGGASAFTLWGAVALNGVTHPNWWDYVVRIVHEYSHSLLFGIAAEEELVRNDPKERYMSPLRGTPRPIDGIYHACYVSARQFLLKDILLARLAQSENEPDRDTMIAEFSETRRKSEESYKDCMTVLEEHADLTDLGKQVLDDTAAYMRA